MIETMKVKYSSNPISVSYAGIILFCFYSGDFRYFKHKVYVLNIRNIYLRTSCHTLVF